MNALKLWQAAELFIQLVIFYSIASYFVEIELVDPEKGSTFLLWSEGVVTGIFTVEYLIRWIASRRIFYPFQFTAVIDLLAILPFYLSFMVDLRALRLVRTLRILRLLKLHRCNKALRNILGSFYKVRFELGILGFVTLIIGLGSSIAIFEFEKHEESSTFERLSDAASWSFTTLGTGSYGDKSFGTVGARTVAVLTTIAGLGVYGTFISVVGSAFLSGIRDRKAKKRCKRKIKDKIQ